ncbi:queuosine precursor transporter [bacterium]|nr:queuosine precursor transporter [bacterium]
MNELIFIAQSSAIALGSLVALWLGKEALVAFICMLSVLSNFFVLKQISLCGLQSTAAESFSIGAILGLHLLQEYFGSKIAKKAIWICFFCLFLYITVSQMHLWYTPGAFDIQHNHFHSLLQFTPRIAFASLFSYFFVHTFDRYLYQQWLKKFGHSHLVWRNYALLSLSQLLDTILFTFLGLWGLVHNATHIIIVCYITKMAAILITTPFVALSKKIYKNRSS